MASNPPCGTQRHADSHAENGLQAYVEDELAEHPTELWKAPLERRADEIANQDLEP